MKLLNIEASPRREKSDSINLASSFLEECKAQSTSLEIDTLNVWETCLPEFDAEAIGAKYKAIKQEELSDKEAEVWQSIQCLIARFQAADRLILATPMWNFSIPYKLKQLIDLVAQRNYLFTYDGQHYGPSLNISKGVVIYTRGSLFREETPLPPSKFDHQAPYIDFWLQLIGVRELRSVTVDNAWNRDKNESEKAIGDGKQNLKNLVDWFTQS